MSPKKLFSIYIFLFFACAITFFKDRKINLFVYTQSVPEEEPTNSEVYALVRSGVAAAMSGNDRQFRFLIIQLFSSTYKFSLFQIVAFNEVLNLIKNKKLEFTSRSEVHGLITQLTKMLTLDFKDPQLSRPIVRRMFQEIRETYKVRNKELQKNPTAKGRYRNRRAEIETESDSNAVSESTSNTSSNSASPSAQVDQSTPKGVTAPVKTERKHTPSPSGPVSLSPPKDSVPTRTQTDTKSGEEESRQSLQKQRSKKPQEEIIGCQSESDRAILYENADKIREGDNPMKPRNRFYDHLLSCSLSNFGAGEATIKCVQEKMKTENRQLSDQCLRCFKESVQCGRSNCTFSCMFSSACGDTCFNCGVKYCQDNLKTCTGLPDLPSACA